MAKRGKICRKAGDYSVPWPQRTSAGTPAPNRPPHGQEQVSTPFDCAPPEAVLDTQAVLDWWWFHDPCTAGWEDLRLAGHWHWVATAAMRAELAHVLARGHLPGDAQDRQAQVLAAFDARCSLTPEPAPQPAGWSLGLRCTDRDDQKFIDLAAARRVRWLISRDKAVLKLRRKLAERCGVAVLAPRDWHVGAN